jgi:predicted DCC family thiol-disulfide oxidoreductase YuxK
MRWLGGAATAREVGLLRVFVCLLLWFSVVREDLASIAVFPREMALPRGIMRLFWDYVPGYYTLGQTAWMLNALEWLTGGFLLLAGAGLLTRLTVPIAFVCYVIFAGMVREYFFIFHQNLIPMLMLGVMAFLPVGDSYSIDRLIRLARDRPVRDDQTPSVSYGLMRAAIWSPLAFGYFAAGVSKMLAAGIGWANADAMQYRVIEVAVAPMHMEFSFANQIAALPSWMFVMMGLATLVSETGYPVIYISRTARWIVPVLTVGMHTGIFILQRILFLDLVLLQFCILPWQSIYPRLRQWLLARGAAATVLFDGWCPLCRRTVRVLGACDLFELVTFHDFRTSGVGAFAAGTTEARLRERLEVEMAVQARGGLRFGLDGYARLLLRLPLLWPLLPVLWVPGFSHAARGTYTAVAARRQSLLQCSHACLVGETPALHSLASAFAPAPAPRPYRRVLAGAAVLYLIIIVFRIEYYPLTALQMFTDTNREDSVHYAQLVAVYSDGHRERYFPENDAGILADLSDTRYRFRFIEGIEHRDPYVLQVYQKLMARHNMRAPAHLQIERIELERWAWNFKRDPGDLSRGSVTRRFAVERSSY